MQQQKTADGEKDAQNIFDTIDPKMLARIQALRLMDDDFMTVVFESDAKLTEFLLRILLSRDDLSVKSVMTQKEKRNLFGRSVRLDIIAEDTAGKLYNIEVQRANKGAVARRARYNLAMLDSHTLRKDDDFTRLPETYIIFITENDIYRSGQPFYKINKTVEITAGGKADLPFDDGSHIIYVNGAYRADDAIGRLMHDFCEPNADKMYYDEVASRVRFHKQQTQGVGTMCKIFEEYGDERAAEARAKAIAETRAEANAEFVESLLRDGTLPQERIAAIAKVPLEQVQRIAQKIAASAIGGTAS